MKKTKSNYKASLSLRRAISFLEKNANTALELGCGKGKDTLYLLDLGFNVTAVDINQKAITELDNLVEAKNSYQSLCSDFQDFDFKKYDLINAQNSLQFINKQASFNDIWQKMLRSLNPRGIFTGTIFGNEHEWATSSERMIFHTKQDVQNLIEGYEQIEFSEIKRIADTFSGEKVFNHCFDITIKKQNK